MKISPSHVHTFSAPNLLQKPAVPEESTNRLKQGTEEQAETTKLKKRDQEVRSHEQAHIAAAGGLARGGATFSFQRGPDGKQYAVGGEVNIDTSPVSGNPQATIRKAQQIRAAALAPANPSAQDRAVAASASALESQAKRELQQKEQESPTAENKKTTTPSHPHIDLFV